MVSNPVPRRPAARGRQGRSELAEALRNCRGAFLGVAAITAAINILYLTGSFFMLEVYDRVIPSRSIPTLIGLCVIALALYAFQGIMEILRSRILVRVGSFIDETLSGRVFDIVVRLPLRTRPGADGMSPLRDLDQIRSFLSSLGPTALFDLPWIPLYLGICYLFHPLIGLAALIGAALLIALTYLTEVLTRAPSKTTTEHYVARTTLAEAGRRNAEALQALGMAGRFAATWGDANQRYMDSQKQMADIAGGFGAASKVLRMVLQSAVLALGAYLVVHGDATGGVMIASSILTSRALAPVELAIANWKGFVAARQSWRRLNELLASVPAQDEPMLLPRPQRTLSVEGVSATPPNIPKLVVHDVSFRLQAGQALGIIGPSASGKSSLVRLIANVWAPGRGKIRLDGAALDQWSPEQLGQHVGYLPQDVELFAGTVAQNIARFDPDPDPAAIIAAAETAGVHDLVLRLSEGYETQIGDGGTALSAGQRQRIALARALYRDPFLVILDEPNSNLDAEGEQALSHAMVKVRERGGIVIVVAHRPSALASVDHVLVMMDGRLQHFGPKDEVLAKVLRPAQVRAPVAAAGGAVTGGAGAPLRVVGEAQGA